MLTRTSEYALRALIHLAQHEQQWPIPGNQIAAQADIPAKYLSAVLSTLVHAGILESTRGKSGGFRMVRSPRQTALIDVLRPFEQFERRRCPFGNRRCSDEDPCQAHDHWKKVVSAQQEFLKHTSVYDVAVKRKKRGRQKTARRKRTASSK